MSKELSILDDTMQLPAHLRAAEELLDSNNELSGGVGMGYPVISYKGKSWAVNAGGQRQVILDPRTGDPAGSIELVILKANPHLSKVYYPSGYVEGSEEKPACYSNDGIAPAADALNPQSNKCATCPNNAWGSRTTENGSKAKACADSRRLAVAPAGELDRPMLLRVPAATLRDLAQYGEALKRRRAPYQAVVTKIGFDPSVAHPQFVFKAQRWLTEAEFAKVNELLGSEVVSQIVGATSQDAASSLDTSKAGTAPVAVREEPSKVATKAPATPAKAAASAKPVTTGFTSSTPEASAPPPKSKSSELASKVSAELDDVLAQLDD